jgi:2-dehydropantoate 2-reductase
VTAQGATLVAPGLVRHGGNGATHMGEPQGEPTGRVEDLVALFNRAGLETRSSATMELLVWEKLLVNVGINAITALTGTRNGAVAEIEEARELSLAAVEEAIAVARARGFDVRPDMVERVQSVARATAVNRSSMGQDVDSKKRTEIEAINGAIVRFGEEADIAVPVNRTLTRLVKITETAYLSGR